MSLIKNLQNRDPRYNTGDRDYMGWMDFGRRSVEEYEYPSWGPGPPVSAPGNALLTPRGQKNNTITLITIVSEVGHFQCLFIKFSV